jgi:hypothetical protein
MRIPYFIVDGYARAANASRVRPKMSSARTSGDGEGVVVAAYCAASNLSSVIGRSRTRVPVAL